MRVTFLLPRYGWYPSGGFRVVYTYADLLVQRGHDVHVVHPRRLPPGGRLEPKNVIGKARRAGGRLRERLLRPSLAWARPDPRVRMWHVREIAAPHLPDADAVIATWWSTAEAALALPPSKGERFHLVQGYETWGGPEARVHAAWRAPLHKIFVARWLLHRALELGVPESMTTLIPNAIAHDVFRLLRPVADRPRRVAMLYSSEWYKGGDIGLEILRRVRTRVPDLSATLFGVERAPRGLPPWVEYVRRATAPQLAAEVYNRSSVYLCASQSEGWPLPPAEAMACGCALVTSDIGGVHDYATQEETALLYPAGAIAEAADRVVELVLDDSRRMLLAERGRDRIRAFSWDRSAERLIELLSARIPAGGD